MTEDETFLAEFEAQRWPLAQWHHRDHIKLAYLYLLRYPLELAGEKIGAGIRAHNAAHQIREAISYGAIKMNIDTDLQWAFWEGVLNNYKKNEGYLQGQLGNPEGDDKPNKKFYDPRVWLRKGEDTFIKRLEVAFEDLNCINRNA